MTGEETPSSPGDELGVAPLRGPARRLRRQDYASDAEWIAAKPKEGERVVVPIEVLDRASMAVREARERAERDRAASLVKSQLSFAEPSVPFARKEAEPPVEEVFKAAVGLPRALRDLFTHEPYSVLDAKQGYWTERKRLWIGLGIKGEEGRAGEAVYASQAMKSPNYYDLKRKAEAARAEHVAHQLGRPLTTEERAETVLTTADFQENYFFDPVERGGLSATGTSVFDPVLTELAYTWFCPPGGQVVDPFAGGSVRGIVAAITGRRYFGVDLRPEQIEANRDQAATILAPGGPVGGEYPAPVWEANDSLVATFPAADLMFTCPPYADLEVYSEDPRDLSRMEWAEFVVAYAKIIARSTRALRDNRFAAIVVGEIRGGPNGEYRGLIPETIAAFEAVGLRYYNEAIMLTPSASAALRATKQFAAGRKLVKIHQNLLVFVKGDPKRATEACDPEGRVARAADLG